jgi:hypothetical protein
MLKEYMTISVHLKGLRLPMRRTKNGILTVNPDGKPDNVIQGRCGCECGKLSYELIEGGRRDENLAVLRNVPNYKKR